MILFQKQFLCYAISEKHLLIGEVEEFPCLREAALGDSRLRVLFAIGGEAFAHFAFQPFQVNTPMGAKAKHDVFVIVLLGGE